MLIKGANMNKINKVVFSTLISTCAVFANESFGGIGISFQNENDGAKILEIIPNTPAAESKLQINDKIIAVDGISLKGKSTEETKQLLRGPKNKPLEVTFISNGDTLSTILSRVQITVKALDQKDIENWYGDKKKLNSSEIETYATETENDKKLLAVLKKGAVLQNKEATSATNLDGIYAEKPKAASSKGAVTKPITNNIATLRNFDRKSIAFDLKEAGKATVTITNVDGKQIAQFNLKDAKAGYNSIPWNGEKVPNGNYTVSIDYNSSTSGTVVTLK